jgi:hypothetical protein
LPHSPFSCGIDKVTGEEISPGAKRGYSDCSRVMTMKVGFKRQVQKYNNKKELQRDRVELG